MSDDLAVRPDAQVAAIPGRSEEAFTQLRETLGTVAPRHPVNRRLGPRRYRLDLLAEVCEAETFRVVTEWLASNAVPAVQSKRAYADDVRMWATVARELTGCRRFYLGAITSGEVTTWRLSEERRNRSPRTINRRLSVLSALSQYAAWLEKKPIVNPVTKYDRLPVDEDDETTATPILEVPEFQAVVEQATTAAEALIPTLIYTLAGRVTECCLADREDLHYAQGKCELHLRRKGNKRRAFTLPEPLCELAQRASAGRRNGPLLVGPDGGPLDRHGVDRLLTRLGKQAGVLPGRDLTPHVLRASQLTHMHDRGVPLDEIRKFADHAKPSTTLRYIRRRDDSKLKARHAAEAATVYENILARWA